MNQDHDFYADFPPPGTAWQPAPVQVGWQPAAVWRPAAAPEPPPVPAAPPTEADTFAQLFPETAARLAAVEQTAAAAEQLFEAAKDNPAVRQVLAMLGVSLD